MLIRRCFPPLLVFAAAGCATGGEFPSLAPRAVEQLSFEEPVKVDPPVTPDPALRARANALLDEARAGDNTFDAAYAQALPRVRDAGGPGSDSWVQAQEAISRVEAARSTTSSALSDFDTWLTEISALPVNTELWAEIIEVRAGVFGLVDEQNRRLNSLKASVSRP